MSIPLKELQKRYDEVRINEFVHSGMLRKEAEVSVKKFKEKHPKEYDTEVNKFFDEIHPF